MQMLQGDYKHQKYHTPLLIYHSRDLSILIKIKYHFYFNVIYLNFSNFFLLLSMYSYLLGNVSTRSSFPQSIISKVTPLLRDHAIYHKGE